VASFSFHRPGFPGRRVVGLPARYSGAAVWKETETITLMSISFIYPASLWLLLLVPLTALLAWIGPRRPTRARFWGGLALRAFLLTLVILALAGNPAPLESRHTHSRIRPGCIR
jgi:hypothetical protein